MRSAPSRSHRSGSSNPRRCSEKSEARRENVRVDSPCVKRCGRQGLASSMAAGPCQG